MKKLFTSKRNTFNKYDIEKIGKILLSVDDCEDKTSEYGGDETVQLTLVSKESVDEMGPLCIDIYFNEDELIFINPKTGGKTTLSNDQIKELESFLRSDLVVRESERKKEIDSLTNNLVSELDKDNNGILDIVESKRDFNTLLKTKQNEIIKIDKNYIHSFVKLSKYLETKGQSLQEIFENIQRVEDKKSYNKLIESLNEQIQIYNLTLVHSLNMVISLTSSDLITFYEIYETFDKSNVFQSNWEKEIMEKLDKISEGIELVMIGIKTMEKNLISEISNLSYITEESFKELNKSVIYELDSINSSINFNNLLTGISTYQLYQINKSTRSLRG